MKADRRFLPYLLTFILFALLVWGAREISFTSDEPAHIATGYALLARGKDAFWMLPPHGHPPLLNVLEASLLYLENPAIPLEQLDGWSSDHIRYVRAFVKHLPPPERAEIIARFPIILCTLLLGTLMFRWGKELWGFWPGLIALFILCFDPLLLAHGRLATTDAGSVALGTASLYLAERWMRSPTWKKALGLGLLMGFTMLAKGSGVIWAGTIGGVIVWKIAQSPQQRWERLLQGLLAGWIGLMIVWAGFAFTLGPIRGLPGVYPAPDYWAGIFEQAQSSERRWVFALEKRQFGNWWWYFPLAFLIKNPLPLLFAFLISVAYVFRLSYRMCPMVPLSFSIIYTGIAIGNGMNIGYRHMLPIHPVIYLLVGRGTTLWLSSPPFFRKRFIGLLMGFWYIAGTICIFPYEIAYFNELIGGPQNAHHYLIDSNLDWGQGYKALRRYLSSHPGPTPKMIYQYAYIPPEYYKIPVLAFPVEDVAPSIVRPFHPDPGRYILNITTVQSGWLPGSDVYFWFRQARPTATVGYSFFIYDVDRLPPQWIAQCSVPVTPLSKEVIIWGFGQRNLRQIEFNCESGWIYPFGGTQPGVYGFHYALLKARRETLRDLLFSFPEPRDLFLSRHLEQTRLSVDMKQYTADYPAFALYELEGFLKMPAVQSAIYLSDSGVPAGTLRSDTVPLALKGPLTFLGVNTFWENSEMNVETWWQVTEGPITRPLSIMGHLLNEAGEMIGQDDGLGVPPVIWQPGDIIVQRHRFPLPPKGEKFWLRTGVYWLDTMERWAIAEKPDLDIIFIKLPEAR